MQNSPLNLLCHDISSIILRYVPIFERKKFWEDLGDKVKETVYTKSPDGNYIASEIILSNLDEDHGKPLLDKMDAIYMYDHDYGLYYLYKHFTSLLKSEYWEKPKDDDVCDYSDGSGKCGYVGLSRKNWRQKDLHGWCHVQHVGIRPRICFIAGPRRHALAAFRSNLRPYSLVE